MSSVEVGTITYQLFTGPNRATAISNRGASGNISIPTSVTSNSVSYPVTGILSAAFQNSAVGRITIPNTVTSVANNSFSTCTSLTSAILNCDFTSVGTSTGCFNGCTTLANVTLSSNTTVIPNSFFLGCTLLRVVTIPNNVTSIGTSAFQNCSSLPTISIPSILTNVGTSAFQGCSALTSITFLHTASIPTLGTNVFLNISTSGRVIYQAGVSNPTALSTNTGITNTLVYMYLTDTNSLQYNIRSNDGMGYISGYSGTNTTLNIPTTVTYISNTYNVKNIDTNAFLNKSSLTSIIIPTSITYIGDSAFKSCTSLTSINIPSFITNIGTSCFSDCSLLSSATFNFTNFTTANTATYCFQNCIALTSVTFPASLSYLPDYFFSGCTALQSIPSLPNTISTIGQFAFENCTALTSVLPSNGIGSHTLIGCFYISSTVTTIGTNAFKNCSGFNNIVFLHSAIPTIGTNAFIGISSSCRVFYLSTATNTVAITGIIPSAQIGIIYIVASSFSYYLYNTINTASIYSFAGTTTATITGSVVVTNTYNITNITKNAFLNKTSLTTLTIGNNVTYIGESAFQGCTSLSSVTFSNTTTLPNIDVNAFSSIRFNYMINYTGTVTNPLVLFNNNNTGIELDGHVKITGYVLRNITYEIDTSFNRSTITAYSGASTDSSLNIPYEIDYTYTGTSYPVKIIGTGTAIFGSSVFTSLSIPYLVTSIGTNCFQNCTSLANVYFYSTQSLSIGTGSFSGTPSSCIVYYDPSGVSLTSLKTFFTAVTNNNNYIIIYTENNVVYSIDAIDQSSKIINYNINKSSLTSLTIPSFITYIRKNYRVIEINNSTFSGCINLSSLTIPYSVTKIGNNAFNNSIILTSLIIPQSVNSIGSNAFSGNSLNNIYFLNPNSFTLGTSAFNSTPTSCKIYYYEAVSNVKTYFGTDMSYNILYTDLNNITYILSDNNSNYTAQIYGYNGYIDQLTSLKIPSTVKYYGFVFNIVSIARSAFNGSTNLTSLIIPGSIISIGNSAFDCSNVSGVGFLHTDLLPTDMSLNNAFTSINPKCIAYCYSTVSNTNVLTADGFINIRSMGIPPIVCFKEGTKILTDKGYMLIQDLRRGYLVKTLKNGYKPIFIIGKKEINHIACEERIKDQLYKCSNSEYPEVFEDLVITGCHSILVDKFIDDQREQIINLLKDIYTTDDKFRLPACIDKRATVYEMPGKYTIYHFALENESERENYGVYANGLLVETCSKRYITKYSHMEVIE